MKQNVLVAGGTGLIGCRLTEILIQNGYQVSYLSRTGDHSAEIKKYQWGIEEKHIEEEAINKADYIVNLAGSNVFDKKWSKEIKKEILESRTNTVNLLYDTLKVSNHKIKAFINASAIGYYGVDTGSKTVNEESPSGDDFLAKVVKKWEEAVDKIQELNIRVVKFRIGIVLSDKGGALEKLITPIKLNAGAVLASGKQHVSWIHIDDLCLMILKALEANNMKGVYNAVAPNTTNNEELTKTAAEKVGKSIFLPNVPAFALKLFLGSEKSLLVTGGSKVSAAKILNTGFKFKFPNLSEALEDILKES